MKKYLSLIVVGILFFACQPTNELGTPFQKGQEVSLTASIGEPRPQTLPGMQRVSGKDAGDKINLTWDEGDQILVKVGNLSSVFTLAEGVGTVDGTFNGFMPADGSSFDVKYPVDYSDEVLKEQTYVKNGFGKGLMKMSTKTAGTLNEGFTLCSDNALLGLQLTGNQTLGKIVLTNLSNDATYTLYCEGVVLKANEATMFYIVVPVVGWTDGMLVEVYDQDESVILRKEKKGAIAFDATEAMVMPSLEARGPGKRIGVFSVSPTQKVSFSQGNLQYIQSTKTWQFAENQLEYIGTANVNDGALADKIDLFGWSADNTTAPFGVSTSTNDADYTGEFVDWGNNIISSEASGTWRTLSADEWEYLFRKRKNASDLYGVAQVAGVNGMIILPDDWEKANGIVFKSGLYSVQVNDYSVYQSFTDHQWLAMENAGAVFLPALGYRDGTNVEKCNTSGYYWSNTTSDEKSAYRLYFYSYFLNPIGIHSKYRGRSVRLVHDTIPPVLTFTVNGVSFNMIYVEGGTFTMGATPEQQPDALPDEYPAHEVTLSSYYIAETELTQELWTALMGTTLRQHYENSGKPDNALAGEGDQYPMYKINQDDCRDFMTQLNRLTGKHFRMPTEAEWEYAARGGKYSKGYKYPGGNNLNDLAWYKENSNNSVHEVKQKRPNELGLYDMAGNVWEWVSDFYEQYPSEAQTNPTGSTTSTQAIIRGGSRAVSYGANDCRVSARNHGSVVHTTTRNFIGLRMVMEID